MAKISVACKLPNGYVAEHGDVSVEFAGANSPGAIGGFGITQGVDEAWFNAWWTANIDTPLVKNEIIFANTPAKVADEATEKKSVKTGLEPVDPDKPGEGIEKRKDD